MLAASLIIAAIATWLAFHLLADALDHISNETAKAHGFTSTDGGEVAAARENLRGEASRVDSGQIVVGIQTNTQFNNSNATQTRRLTARRGVK